MKYRYSLFNCLLLCLPCFLSTTILIAQDVQSLKAKFLSQDEKHWFYEVTWSLSDELFGETNYWYWFKTQPRLFDENAPGVESTWSVHAPGVANNQWIMRIDKTWAFTQSGENQRLLQAAPKVIGLEGGLQFGVNGNINYTGEDFFVVPSDCVRIPGH